MSLNKLRFAVAAVCISGLVLAAASASAHPSARVQGAIERAKAPSSQLDRVRVISSANGSRIYRYEQRIGGIAVLGSDTIVIAPASDRPRLASDHSTPDIGAVGRARVSRARALAVARSQTATGKLSSRPSARLAIAKRGGGTLVWQTELTSDDPISDRQVLVDALSGKVLRTIEMLKGAGEIRARLYDTNAVMANNGYSGGIADDMDRDSPLLTSLRRGVVLGNVGNDRGCLKGSWANARLGPGKKQVCLASGDYRKVTRRDDRFEALMSYFFVDRAQDYIQSLALGAPINQRRQVVNADSIPDDNSYYTPGDRQMTLGTGGVDDAEDGDVITHEYGHAVQDDQVPGFGENFPGSAFGEGFGDYLAASVSAARAPQPVAPLKDWNQCMFEWDATGYTNNQCARRTTLTFTLPQAIQTAHHDPHIVGEAWSSALWSLRGSLGEDIAGHAVMDRVVLESHFLLTKAPKYFEGAQALVDADELLYGGTHCAQITAEMVSRKFFDATHPAPSC